MEVLMLIGRYAGEIRDIVPHAAHDLVRRGDAIDPNALIDSEIPAPAITAEMQVPAVVAKRKK